VFLQPLQAARRLPAVFARGSPDRARRAHERQSGASRTVVERRRDGGRYRWVPPSVVRGLVARSRSDVAGVRPPSLLAQTHARGEWRGGRGGRARVWAVARPCCTRC
jgi:hypothetical protein